MNVHPVTASQKMERASIFWLMATTVFNSFQAGRAISTCRWGTDGSIVVELPPTRHCCRIDGENARGGVPPLTDRILKLLLESYLDERFHGVYFMVNYKTQMIP